MTRPSFSCRFALAIACLVSVHGPLTRLYAQCCGGSSGGTAAQPVFSRVSGGDDSAATSIRITNPGLTPIQIVVGMRTIIVPAGTTVTTKLTPLPGEPPLAEGEKLTMAIKSETGGPPGANDTAEVSWTFPKRDKKGECKKEEAQSHPSAPKNESCGTKSTLSATTPAVSAQCGSAAPKSGSGSPSDGSKGGGAGSGAGGGGGGGGGGEEWEHKDSTSSREIRQTTGGLNTPASGQVPDLGPARIDFSVQLGHNNGSTFSAGVLVADGALENLNSYLLRGQSGPPLEVTFSGNAPSQVTKAWKTDSALTVAYQENATTLKFSSYPPSTFVWNSSNNTVSLNAGSPNLPNHRTTITNLPVTATPVSGQTVTALQYRITEAVFNSSSAVEQNSWSTTTLMETWTTAAATPVPVERRYTTTTEQQGVVLSVSNVSTTYNLAITPAERMVSYREWTGPANSGILHEWDEVVRYFPWGEEKISRLDFPNGKIANAPVILTETEWWSDDAAAARYATVKLMVEKHGIWNGSAAQISATAGWTAFYTVPDSSAYDPYPSAANPNGSIAVEVTPWRNGSSVPLNSDSFSTLSGLATSSGDYKVSRNYTAADGDWIRSTSHLGNVLVESSEDTDPSRHNDEVLTKINAGANSFSVTRTESPAAATGDNFLQPTLRYELREGAVGLADSDLISRTRWSYEDMYADATTPQNPLLATTVGGGGAVAKWKRTWTTTVEFPDSAATGSPAPLFIKTSRMVDRASGLPVVESRYLTTNEFGNSGDVHLQTKVYLYDSLARPLIIKSSRLPLTDLSSSDWTTDEEWAYTDALTSQTVLHTDAEGVQVSTVTNLLGQKVSRTLLANGQLNQFNIVTSWAYAARAGAGTIITKTVNAGNGWIRTTSEEYDGVDRLVASTDETGINLGYTFAVNSSGEKTEATIHTNTTPQISREYTVSHRVCDDNYN
jgi:hypothetical protein